MQHFLASSTFKIEPSHNEWQEKTGGIDSPKRRIELADKKCKMGYNWKGKWGDANQ